jgi:hypothetical protein
VLYSTPKRAELESLTIKKRAAVNGFQLENIWIPVPLPPPTAFREMFSAGQIAPDDP